MVVSAGVYRNTFAHLLSSVNARRLEAVYLSSFPTSIQVRPPRQEQIRKKITHYLLHIITTIDILPCLYLPECRVLFCSEQEKTIFCFLTDLSAVLKFLCFSCKIKAKEGPGWEVPDNSSSHQPTPSTSPLPPEFCCCSSVFSL